jgi:hypothetical protein
VKFTKLRHGSRFVAIASVLGFSTPSFADSSLRSALLEVWPRYVSFKAMRDFANECEPQSASANNQSFAKWQTGLGLSDQLESLLSTAFSAREIDAFRATERKSLLPKMRQQFPNCVSSAQLRTFLESSIANGSLHGMPPNALATVQKALNTAVAKPLESNTSKGVAAPVATSSNAAAVDQSTLEGVYMDQVPAIGYGGMVILDFASFAVYKDGTICKDIRTIAVGRSGKLASRCGQWTRAGNGFTARWQDGKTSKLEGNTFYRTFPASKGETLNGRYTATGGGGNTALGGDSAVFVSKTYVFAPDGTFSTQAAGGGGNSGVTTLSRSSNGGTYTLDRHTIELRFNDGRVLRDGFFFFPSKGQKTTDAIGIGDSVYSLKNK